MTVEQSGLPWGNIVRKPATDNDTLVHVHRDPCPKCGIRADIGCKHVRRG